MVRSILILVIGAAALAQSPSVDGNWQGVLGTSLRVGLHIIKTSSGGYNATLDVIDQARSGVPVEQITVTGTALHFEIPSLNAKFDGTVKADGSEIAGMLSDGVPAPGKTGVSRSLIFLRVNAIETLARPQNPKGPFPYTSVEVSYENKADRVTLGATLTLPQGNGPFPAVILITGSGPQDRDETISGHKPFPVIADYLTRRGIAVLRADDRGVGSSSGEAATATLGDMSNDVLAGIQYLKGRREIDEKLTAPLRLESFATRVSARRPA